MPPREIEKQFFSQQDEEESIEALLGQIQSRRGGSRTLPHGGLADNVFTKTLKALEGDSSESDGAMSETSESSESSESE
jgi:hypothetical protein